MEVWTSNVHSYTSILFHFKAKQDDLLAVITQTLMTKLNYWSTWKGEKSQVIFLHKTLKLTSVLTFQHDDISISKSNTQNVSHACLKLIKNK